MEFTLKSGMPILTLSVTSRTLTSACPGSPSSRAPETMLGSRAARSGSTPTAGGAHGGGAFSGRDRTRSTGPPRAAAGRRKKRPVVRSGLCRRALAQESNAVGVTKLSPLFVATYEAEQGDLSADGITNVIKIAFD